MAKLVYTEQEIMSDHDYARPHQAMGHRLHGGFDASGHYIPPRTRVRVPAVRAWTDALRARSGDVLAVDPALMSPDRYPNEAQMKLLLREGVDRVLWDSFTTTGLLEARGRFIADAVFPDLQKIIVEDISGMAIGHLSKGMLKAHGLDEGGEPARGIGAHDVMWFVVRDLAFGPRSYPMPTPPEFLGRPDSAARLAPELPQPFEQLVLLMMNLLLIEYGAESLFSFDQRLLLDPELFRERRAQADEAAAMIERIRADEAVHVTSLRVDLGELRSVTFKKTDGGTIAGAEIVDRLWDVVVRFVRDEQPKLRREQQTPWIERTILDDPRGGERVLAAFRALAG
ncbi:MAG: hypothetical protein FJ108_12605 [Deltaproteobacteria bacterium]|nr:hypothetical protein [Deltaproteobacteria bacterium]